MIVPRDVVPSPQSIIAVSALAESLATASVTVAITPENGTPFVAESGTPVTVSCTAHAPFRHVLPPVQYAQAPPPVPQDALVWLATGAQVVGLLQHPPHPLVALQRHCPPEQVVPAAHGIAQPPQFCESLARSAHVPPQSDVPEGHTRAQAKPPAAPRTHLGAAAVQLVAQAPQLVVDWSDVTQPAPASAQSA